MGNLNEDLEQYADEFFTKKDLKAGLKLLGEITGIVAIGGIAITALTVWLPGVGIVVPGAVAARALKELSKSYSNLDTKQRKHIRAAVKFLRGGFSYKDFS